jgi:hypothetical protein
LLIFGLLIDAVGAVSILASGADRKRRKRVHDTPTSRIVDARGGLVEIEGRVESNTASVLHAPFSGRPAVYVHATIDESPPGQRSKGNTIFKSTTSTPFTVLDASGGRAQVRPEGARVVVDENEVFSAGLLHEVPPNLQAFLERHGLRSRFLGVSKSLTFREELLAPGDPVFANGPSRLEAPSATGGDEAAPGSALVLYSAGRGKEQLVLSNKSERQVVEDLRAGTTAGAFLLTLGLVLTALGWLMHC